MKPTDYKKSSNVSNIKTKTKRPKVIKTYSPNEFLCSKTFNEAIDKLRELMKK